MIKIKKSGKLFISRKKGVSGMFEKKIRRELARKSKDSLKKFQFIGAEIKSSRLKLSKTLDSIGNVNKSISYISKIENNKIIPNQRCLMELCDELLIAREDLESMSKFDEFILEAIDAIYMNDKVNMARIYDKFSLFKNTRTNLIIGLNHYMFNNHNELKRVVDELKVIENSLSIEDYLVYVLLCIKDFILDNNVTQAHKVVQVVLESETAKSTLLNVFKMIQFDIKLMYHVVKFETDFNEIVQMHVNNYNFNRVEEVVLDYSKLKVELAGSSIKYKDIEKISDNGLKFYAYCLKGDFERASKLYKDDIDDKYKLYFFYKLSKLDEIKKMIVQTMSEENMILANSYKYDLEGNIEVYRNYLINICLPYFSGIAKVKYVLHFYDILLDLNAKTSKYKESSIFGKEIVKLIAEISELIT